MREKKALILPGCMRSRSESDCHASSTSLGLKCERCDTRCKVRYLNEIGDQKHFEVYIVPHESSAFTESTEKERKQLGILGVACVSNLISGGWKADSMGIPAQCVLLDNCGCKHWTKENIKTDINQKKLIELIDLGNSIKDISISAIKEKIVI
jgi:hypothetical protein